MTPTFPIVHSHFVHGFFVRGDLEDLASDVIDFIMMDCGIPGCPVDFIIHKSPLPGESGWVFFVPDSGFATKQGDLRVIDLDDLTMDPTKVEAFLTRCRQVEGLPVTELAWLLC